MTNDVGSPRGRSSFAINMSLNMSEETTIQQTIAGPVTVSSSAPILAWQRVQYYQTFNEICAG